MGMQANSQKWSQLSLPRLDYLCLLLSSKRLDAITQKGEQAKISIIDKRQQYLPGKNESRKFTRKKYSL